MNPTYTFSQDKIYEDRWKVENNKAICTHLEYDAVGDYDYPWILINPAIPIGSKAHLRIKRGDSKG